MTKIQSQQQKNRNFIQSSYFNESKDDLKAGSFKGKQRNTGMYNSQRQGNQIMINAKRKIGSSTSVNTSSKLNKNKTSTNNFFNQRQGLTRSGSNISSYNARRHMI